MGMYEFSPADMQTVMLAIERICIVLKLSDSDEHLRLKSRVSALIIEMRRSGRAGCTKID